MKNKNDIKTIFYQYKIYKFKLEKNHKNILISDLDEINNQTKIETQWKKYVASVDKILELIPKESSFFLKKLYIENNERRDFHYSESTFYFKQKRAINDFLNFIQN